MVLEVEIDKQKEINRQLLNRDAHMTQLVQLLQQELEQRSSKDLVTAARLREVELQLSEIHPPSQTSEPSSTATQQQQMQDTSKYTSEGIQPRFSEKLTR